MKKNYLLSLIFLITVLTAHSQEQTIRPINSFLGVAFGTSPEVAEKQMQAAHARLDEKNSKKFFRVYTGLKISGRMSDYVYFKYIDDKLYEICAFFKADPQSQTLVLYNQVKNDIALTFGEGTDIRRFSGNYSDGDGDELKAIENGFATYGTTWVEDRSHGKNNRIELMVNADLLVSVRFLEVKSASGKK